MNSLNLLVTEQRVKDVPLEVFYGVDSSPKAQIEFIAHFTTDENGAYLPLSKAVKLVTEGRTIADLADITQQLVDSMEGATVPKK